MPCAWGNIWHEQGVALLKSQSAHNLLEGQPGKGCHHAYALPTPDIAPRKHPTHADKTGQVNPGLGLAVALSKVADNQQSIR